MKKLTYLLAVIFVLGILLSSCNRKVCPAYSQNHNTRTTGKSGILSCMWSGSFFQYSIAENPGQIPAIICNLCLNTQLPFAGIPGNEILERN